MGTINYGSNDWITIGLNPDEFVNDGLIYEEVCEIYKKYDFDYLNVSIQPGYYEGFYIDIEDNFLYYDDWNEKRVVLKEATQLKKFLLECVENGLVKVNPGWCTGYYDYEDSITEVHKAMKQLKMDITNKPTYKTYKRRSI